MRRRISAAATGLARRVGSCSAPRRPTTRSAVDGSRIPSATAVRQAATIPIATASPCRSSSEGMVSIAWPKVWPRLSLARSPFSKGSRDTTPAFTAAEAGTRRSIAPGSPDASSMASRSSAVKPGSPAITACLAHSARPARSSRIGRVDSVSASATVILGCQKAPARFLPRPPPGSSRLTPVLPPIAASTIARSVVGTCTRSTPRR